MAERVFLVSELHQFSWAAAGLPGELHPYGRVVSATVASIMRSAGVLYMHPSAKIFMLTEYYNEEKTWYTRLKKDLHNFSEISGILGKSHSSNVSAHLLYLQVAVLPLPGKTALCRFFINLMQAHAAATATSWSGSEQTFLKTDREGSFTWLHQCSWYHLSWKGFMAAQGAMPTQLKTSALERAKYTCTAKLGLCWHQSVFTWLFITEVEGFIVRCCSH